MLTTDEDGFLSNSGLPPNFFVEIFFGNFEKFLEISTEPEFVAEPTMTQLKSEVFVDFSQKF